MPSQQEESSPCWHMGPIHAIFFYIISIMSLLFHIILIISEIKNAIWVHIHCKKLANLHIHHWGSVSIQTKSIKDSISKSQSLLSHCGSWCNRPIRIGLADVREPFSTQYRLELIRVTQCINSRCNRCALSRAFPARRDP
jgi:hypothetical protein